MAETIEKLISRLEIFHATVRGDDASKSGEQLGGELGRSRTACLRQTDAVRQAIKQRETVIAQGKAHAPEGIAATAAVRRQLNELGACAEKLRKAHEADKVCRSGDSTTWEDREVTELLRNVDDVVASESRKAGTGRAAGGSSKAWTSLSSVASIGARGGGGGALPQDPALQQSLMQIQERDAQMEGGLDAIQQGLGRLRGLATDMNAEVRVQSIMIDEIAAKADHAEAELMNLNKNLREQLRKAGGASRVVVNLLLVILLLSLALFIYQAIKDAGAFVVP